MKSIVLLLTTGIVALMMSACTSVEVYQYKYDTALDDVFIKENADFSGYDSVIIDDVSVWYPEEFAPSAENADKAQANLQKAQLLFRESISKALSDRYQVTDKAGKNVLRVSVEFVDLRAATSTADVPRDLSRYDFKTKPGHITMVSQLFDSKSGEQLARAADLGKQQSFGGNGVVDWDAIGSDFDYWASIFSSWMDRIHQ